MSKVIRYIITALVSAAAIFFIAKFLGGAFDSSLESYASSITDDVAAKRAALLSSGKFRDGITVNNIPIGGMTAEEAREALSPLENGMTDGVGFVVKYGDDGVLNIGMDYFDVSYNTEEILAEAIMLANDGELEQLRQDIDTLAREGKNYTISCNIVPNIEKITAAVTEAGESLNKDAKNASATPIADSVMNGGARFKYKEERYGYRAKTEEAVEEIISRAKAGDYGTVTIEGEVIEPKLTVAQLKKAIVKRSSYKSSYALGHYDAPNRVFNIKKACSIINGTVLEPGDVFSCNKILGKRTEAAGWLPAPGFINGGANSVDSPGGGVCHVSSTLYNAVIRSDLEIVYRINHSSHVGYVPWGLDATIDSNGPDFKFKNNTKQDLFVFMWVDSSKHTVNCELWGASFPSSYDSISFYAEFVEEIPPTATEYITDRNLTAPHWYVSNNAKTGYKYQSFKQYYKDGKPVGDPKPVATSVYRMHPMRIAVWPGFNVNTDTLSRQYKVDPPVPGS
ncbi:MAG: VanW family protein [Clostridia bacterium]|nr:VanW family protein [Clostridia bacterium]